MKKIIILFVLIALIEFQLQAQHEPPTYYIDSVKIEGEKIPLFDPQFIERIEVGRTNGTNGEVFITTKKSHSFYWMYLSSITQKYSKAKTTLFMVDNVFLKSRESVKIDSSYIFKVEKIDTKDFLVFGKKMKNTVILNLVTKTKENIEKSKRIYIRGTAELSKNSN